MRFITADKIFNGEVFLKGNPVYVLDKERIKDIVPMKDLDPLKVEHMEGMLTPGFVNTHCHLELSHLLNVVSMHTGISDFASQLIRNRAQAKEVIEAASIEADKFMEAHGIVACGDISNGSDTFKLKSTSKIYYHTFIELIGLNPLKAIEVFESGKQLLHLARTFNLKASLAPHAPYTVSRALFAAIAGFNGHEQSTLAVHNQESPEETDFFRGTGRAIRGLYEGIGIDVSWFVPEHANSFSYYFDTIQHVKSILVHNTFTGEPEINAASSRDVFWCFCPRANLYIEKALPDLPKFLKFSERLCLGTDSLASNHDLNVLNEANVLLREFEQINESQVLRMLTANGAQALGIAHHYGYLHVGMSPGINLVAEHNRNLTFVKKVA